jgi:gas vesicle protein
MINSSLDAFEEDGWGGLLGHILNIRPATTSTGDLADYYANKDAHDAAAALSGVPLPVVTYEDVSTESTRDMAQAMIDAAKDVLTEGGLEAGQQMGDQLVVGLSGQSDNVVTAVAIMVDQINNELSRVEAINLQINAAGGVAGMTGALSGGKGVAGAVIELDGRKVGQMITPYINQNSGRLVTRTVQTQ